MLSHPGRSSPREKQETATDRLSREGQNGKQFQCPARGNWLNTQSKELCVVIECSVNVPTWMNVQNTLQVKNQASE